LFVRLQTLPSSQVREGPTTPGCYSGWRHSCQLQCLKPVIVISDEADTAALHRHTTAAPPAVNHMIGHLVKTHVHMCSTCHTTAVVDMSECKWACLETTHLCIGISAVMFSHDCEFCRLSDRDCVWGLLAGGVYGFVWAY